MAVVLARLRMPLIYLGLAAILVDSYLWDLPRWPLLGLLAVAFAIYLRLGTVRRSPVEVALPVAGRWLAFNSPADRVPSHHLHAYGQTYAIDLVHEPAGRRRPRLAWWPPARRPEDFPGFGQPVLAPADATVVRAHDGERDHWSRTSPPALLYLVVEGSLRELLGPGRILGNHVVLDLGDGVYAALAHLRRGSVLVRPGDRVAAGQQLAACGNSGNSTEPHLHFQLMDHPSVLLGAGLPLRFARYQVAGADHAGVPGNLQPFTAPGCAAPSRRGTAGGSPGRRR
jgi:murein DD-endopeptidase MepM/ murein hydrolase activator NlpD